MSFITLVPVIRGARHLGQSGRNGMTLAAHAGQCAGEHRQSLRLTGPSGAVFHWHDEHRTACAHRSGRRASRSRPPVSRHTAHAMAPKRSPTNPTIPPTIAAPPSAPPGSSPPQPATAPPNSPAPPNTASHANGRSRRRRRYSSTSHILAASLLNFVAPF